VGQAIAFCGLSWLGKARQPDRRQKPIVCPTLTTQLACGSAALWGSQSWLPPAFSRRLEFLHFGTDFLTVPPRID
jgi:hypothetical protein